MIPEETQLGPGVFGDFRMAFAGLHLVLHQTRDSPPAIPEKTTMSPALLLASCWA